MSIDEVFAKYPQNVFGFRFNQNIKVIDFWLRNDWKIAPNPEKEYEVKQQKVEGENTYYIAYSATLSFAELFDCVGEVIEINLEIEKKTELFNEKMQELKQMFLQGNYSDLKKLNFNVTEQNEELV